MGVPLAQAATSSSSVGRDAGVGVGMGVGVGADSPRGHRRGRRRDGRRWRDDRDCRRRVGGARVDSRWRCNRSARPRWRDSIERVHPHYAWTSLFLPRDASTRVGFASGSARSRRPQCGPRVQAPRAPHILPRLFIELIAQRTCPKMAGLPRRSSLTTSARATVGFRPPPSSPCLSRSTGRTTPGSSATRGAGAWGQKYRPLLVRRPFLAFRCSWQGKPVKGSCLEPMRQSARR